MEKCTLQGEQAQGHHVSVNGARLQYAYPEFEIVGDQVLCGLPGQPKRKVSGLCRYGSEMCPRVQRAKEPVLVKTEEQERYGSDFPG